MEFYINDEKIDITLENEKTIGDVLKGLEMNFEENDAAVVSLIINDTLITGKNFDEYASKDLDDNLKLEIQLITKGEILLSFKNLQLAFKNTTKDVAEISVELQSGKEKNALLTIKKLADLIEEFCRVATLGSLFSEYAAIKIDDKDFSEFFGEFSPVLSDLEQALQSNDTVTVGDLAEYEICPRLEAIYNTLEGIE
ncbi:MAG: hypothetical protein K6F15_00200 [Treponema sp.]|nr:hypothetical protein [Treponema sp.]